MISIIIPTLNEEKALPHTLRQVLSQAGDYEVIVVDGGSTDNTNKIAAEFSSVHRATATQGRAAQMNAGAALAKGEFLLFLHADTLLPEDAIHQLNLLETEPECLAGGFRQRFSGHSKVLRFVSWLHNFRCNMTGIFYGDQAMFVRRELFNRIGRFPDTDILEDIMLSEQLLMQTKPRLLKQTVTTDARKFEQMGSWRSLYRCLIILVSYEMRLPIQGRKFFTPVR